MRKQIPRGDEGYVCPLHQKSMADVCHKCPLWVEIRGCDPQTGEVLDQWNCSLAWLPKLTIDVAHQARAGAAATEDFRNHMLNLNGGGERRQIQSATAAGADRLLAAAG